MRPGAPLIHENVPGNILTHQPVRIGDAGRALAEADVVVEGTYHVPFIEHAYLEPEAAVAEPDGAGGVHLWCGVQNQFQTLGQIADALGLRQERINLINLPMGGAFGGKCDITVQAMVVLGAMVTGRAVKMTLTRAESFHWTSVDGLQIQGWLYRAQPNSRRAVIDIHGGPTYHSEDKFDVQIQYLVAQGFNLLDVNYRGSTGFGLEFREAIKVDGWGGREQADIAEGAKALIQAGLAEPGKVGVTGTSYGGYSSWFLITHYPPEVIGAAAPICGMTDLVVDYQTTRPDLRPYSEEMIGGTPEQIPQRYYERSPIHYVRDIHGQLMIIQGAQDPNVTPENVRQVRQRLHQHEIPYELLVFDDEGHGIIKPANQATLYARLGEFFNRALA